MPCSTARRSCVLLALALAPAAVMAFVPPLAPAATCAGRLSLISLKRGASLQQQSLRMSSSTLSRDEGAPWDAEETARLRDAVIKAARADARKLKEAGKEARRQVKNALQATSTTPEQLKRQTSLAGSGEGKVNEQEPGADFIWRRLPGFESWLAFVKRATKKGYDENGEARPRAPGFKGGATPNAGPEVTEQEHSAVSKWQRSDGPFYVQFTGAAMLLVGFLNHSALKNNNGSGVEGLSQSLFALGILVLLLGFALERKSPDE